MDAGWQYQIRIYLAEELAGVARADLEAPIIRPLANVLSALGATLVSPFDAFEAYVAEAEREGTGKYPLYRWTKATLEDPAKRARHARAFAVHVAGQEVYSKEVADALEETLRPLVGGGLIERLSRHDTNPASNLAVPAEYRA
jgi:hypothetical protein